MATDDAEPEVLSQDEIDRREIIEMARNDYEHEGELEIDDNAIISYGDDNGAYVQAWVWIGFGDTRFDKDP